MAGVREKALFWSTCRGPMKKKSISKNSLGHEVFSHKKIFFLRPVLSPLQRREPKKPFPRKTLKMVLNDASQKAMFVWDKTFFFTLMNKVRVSFSVFFFFFAKISLWKIFCVKENSIVETVKKKLFLKKPLES